MIRRISLFAISILLLGAAEILPESKMVVISAGTLRPLVKTLPQAIAIDDFYLDPYPVTRAHYSEFLTKNPTWWRDSVASFYADKAYLSDWKSITSYPMPANAPVTRVSWFAARAYCRAQGKRLPTAAEWEYVALANEIEKDGTSLPEFGARILSWYTARGEPSQPVGCWKNAWGVYDIHGLVWEWVEDFNGEFTSGDSRGDNSQDPNAFCGGAALNVDDAAKVQYAAFMRYALRGSLKGDYSLRDLGFRCAK